MHYDYIILGSGAAGLSLLMRMMELPQFSQKKILLVDRDLKKSNDRTWCFWESKEGFFESIVYKNWDHLLFYGESLVKKLAIAPYQYKMIRSIDFYEFCFEKIAQCANIERFIGEVNSVMINKNEVIIHFDDRQLACGRATIFNSLYNPSDPSQGSLQLLQHFKGWLIETAYSYFNVNEAVLMDFRVSQENGTSFVYLLPLSTTKALVEYTVFSPATLPKEQYDARLRNYISRFLALDDFNISEEEFGVIPMTNAIFPFHHNGMYNIGTAGGQTKGSTGYTFQFIQKQSEQIVNCLRAGGSLDSIPTTNGRFQFYDSVLLQLLFSNSLEGRQIFTRLFERNRASHVFKFLDNETSLFEELRLISTLQTGPFMKAAIKSILNFKS